MVTYGVMKERVKASRSVVTSAGIIEKGLETNGGVARPGLQAEE
jgi:hypothetical protein